MVKWLRRQPLTLKSGVRLSYGSPRRSKVRFAPFFFAEKHTPASLLLLLRKKVVRVGYSVASAFITPLSLFSLFANSAAHFFTNSASNFNSSPQAIPYFFTIHYYLLLRRSKRAPLLAAFKFYSPSASDIASQWYLLRKCYWNLRFQFFSRCAQLFLHFTL